MKTLILSLSLLIFVFSAYSQSVTVKGRVEGANENLVRIMKYADQFSHFLEQEPLASTVTDGQGNFSITFDLEKTTYAFLALDLKKSEIYLTPGSTYVLEIINDSSLQKGSVFDRAEKPLPVKILSSSDSLNQYISAFNVMFDHFVYNNFMSIYKRHDRKIIDDFKKTVNDTFKTGMSDYFKNYVEYTIASTVWLSRNGSTKKLLKEYFIGKPVLYENIAYTDFFHEFFKGYFNSPVRKDVTYDSVVNLINAGKDYLRFDTYLKNDTLLAQNARVRQLVEMELLKECYYDKSVDAANVENIFGELAARSRYSENRNIAVNYLKRFHRLAYGTPAPGFQLPDIMGKETQLGDFKGKFVLLTFMNTGCKICEKQLEDISKIEERYSEALKIVTVLSGKNPSETIKFFRNKGYGWTLLLLGNKITLLEDYDVKAFPAYILLNPDGTIAMAPAPMPDENLDFFVQRMIKSFGKRK